MSSGKPKRFNGQQWMEQLIRQRTNAALAGLPPAERRLRHDEERKRQEAIYRQERDEKRRVKKLLYEQRMRKQAEIRAAYQAANSQKASAGESAQ